LVLVPTVSYAEETVPIYFKVDGIPKYRPIRIGVSESSYKRRVNKFISDSLLAEKKLTEYIDSVRTYVTQFFSQYYYTARGDYNIDDALNCCRILLNSTGSGTKILVASTLFEGVHSSTLQTFQHDYFMYQTDYADTRPVQWCSRIQYLDAEGMLHIFEDAKLLPDSESKRVFLNYSDAYRP
jgi:hypothetical protein